MPERSQQLLDDDYSPPGHRTETPGAESRSRRRLDTVATAAASSSASAAQKRKRKLMEKEKEKELARVAPASKVSVKRVQVATWFKKIPVGRG
jgi:hypothetical protein